MTASYIIEGHESGWHLFRNEKLIDTNYDPSLLPVREILEWASGAIRETDGIEIVKWVPFTSRGDILDAFFAITAR